MQLCGQVVTLLLRKIRHLGEGVNPRPDTASARSLLRAEGRPAKWNEERGHPAFGQLEEISPNVGWLVHGRSLTQGKNL